MLLTDDPDMAILAQNSGVDRIFYDLEYINKRERQLGRNTVLSNYDINGIPAIKAVLNSTELLVRINPMYFNSKDEIDTVIEYGADVIMLPMVLDANDVEAFVKLVDGRAKVCIMIETPQSFARINDILDVKGIDEIFIGLNDLHIGMGLLFMFEVLSCGMVEYIAHKCKEKNIPFGFGGIAKIGQGELPAENIVGEHYRIGSSSVILSRVFKNSFTSDGKPDISFNFKEEIEKIRNTEANYLSSSEKEFEENKYFVKKCVQKIVTTMQKH
jgi:hypothetical protein